MPRYRQRDARRGDEPEVRRIVFAVLAEYGLSPDPAGTDADLVDLVASYVNRGGAFRIVENEQGEIVGCGGLYRLSEAEAEIRKMYLLPAVRGQGIGRALLEDLIAAARQRGCSRVSLETASVLKEAMALYRRFGFVETHRDDLARRCDKAFALDLCGPAGP
jgi:GNAT superfamily N-acetyltransferase